MESMNQLQKKNLEELKCNRQKNGYSYQTIQRTHMSYQSCNCRQYFFQT
jgi:hypothetical protein